jgi:hypothetical protein
MAFLHIVEIFLSRSWHADPERRLRKIRTGVFISSSLLLIPIILKAFLSGFRGLPTILKKRKEVQNKKRISNWEVFSLFKKYGIKAREIAFKE